MSESPGSSRPSVSGGRSDDWLFLPGVGLVGPVLALVGGATIEGREHIPRRGPILVVSNHLSNLDPPVLGWAIGFQARRVVHFMAKEQMRSWPILGPLLVKAGVFYLRRRDGGRSAQRRALELLAAGEAVGVFPEGHRSLDATLQPGKLGVAMLALRSGAPLLPVAITGTDRILPPGSRMPHRSHVTVRIGAPFLLEPPAGRSANRAELQAGTDTVMRHIARLLPKERQGPYR